MERRDSVPGLSGDRSGITQGDLSGDLVLASSATRRPAATVSGRDVVPHQGTPCLEHVDDVSRPSGRPMAVARINSVDDEVVIASLRDEVDRANAEIKRLGDQLKNEAIKCDSLACHIEQQQRVSAQQVLSLRSDLIAQKDLNAKLEGQVAAMCSSQNTLQQLYSQAKQEKVKMERQLSAQADQEELESIASNTGRLGDLEQELIKEREKSATLINMVRKTSADHAEFVYGQITRFRCIITQGFDPSAPRFLECCHTVLSAEAHHQARMTCHASQRKYFGKCFGPQCQQRDPTILTLPAGFTTELAVEAERLGLIEDAEKARKRAQEEVKHLRAERKPGKRKAKVDEVEETDSDIEHALDQFIPVREVHPIDNFDARQYGLERLRKIHPQWFVASEDEKDPRKVQKMDEGRIAQVRQKQDEQKLARKRGNTGESSKAKRPAMLDPSHSGPSGKGAAESPKRSKRKK